MQLFEIITSLAVPLIIMHTPVDQLRPHKQQFETASSKITDSNLLCSVWKKKKNTSWDSIHRRFMGSAVVSWGSLNDRTDMSASGEKNQVWKKNNNFKRLNEWFLVEPTTREALVTYFITITMFVKK